METLDEFVARLCRDIPCHSHHRQESEGISLKKCDTMVHGRMGQFAAVHDRTTKDKFRIVIKEWLADEWCQTNACERNPKSFGNNPNNPKHAGIIFFVKKDSTGKDYQNTIRCLKVVRNSPQMPPCT